MAKKNTENEKVEVKNEDTVTFEQPITPEVKAAPEQDAPEVKVAPKDVEPEPKKDDKADDEVSKLADEVEAGKYGSGRERMILLGSKYAKVQAEVTRRYKQSIKL